MKTKIHHTDKYLINPLHPITVNVIGCGGTGSHVLTGLARMNEALQALGHMGIYVTAFDSDTVSEANIGRQMFSYADLGNNKAVTLINRINRFYGNDWRGVPEQYSVKFIKRSLIDVPVSNITFSCVDTIKSRKEVKRTFAKTLLRKYTKDFQEPYCRPIYWFDFGNLQKTGQVILSTVEAVAQPSKEAIATLPDIFTLFPGVKKQKDDFHVPSCSMQESLQSQDLYINSILAQNGLNLFWKMFRDVKIRYQGIFVNLETIKMTPLEIKGFDIPEGKSSNQKRIQKLPSVKLKQSAR